MTVLIIGAGGTLGTATTAVLSDFYHVLGTHRGGAQALDMTDIASLDAFFESHGPFEAVVVLAGSVPFGPLAELSVDQFTSGLQSKALGQINVVQRGVTHVVDGGSFTLVSGILTDHPVPGSAAAGAANGAVNGYVVGAATELPRGIRINAVSPTVVAESTGYHEAFRGFEQVPAEVVGRAVLRSIAGTETGQIFRAGW